MVARLFQIVYLLMERDSMTAKELADKLEVSVRTINRDIEKLSEARIPIYATRGRGGGISLLSDFVLNKKVLTEEEKSSILSSMKVLGTVAYDDEKQALSRLEDFFGEVAQDWIEIELDTWNEGNFDRDRFRQLKGAILSHKKLSFVPASWYFGRRRGICMDFVRKDRIFVILNCTGWRILLFWKRDLTPWFCQKKNQDIIL